MTGPPAPGGGVVVVGYLHNTNGMATWCWEAAHALSEAGRAVVLVCGPDVRLPGTPAVEVVRFAPAPRPGRPRGRLAQLIGVLDARLNPFLPELDAHLRAAGVVPAVYLLNQTDLHHPAVPLPQHVVAWAFPCTLGGYLRVAVRSAGWRPSRRLVRAVLTAVGWYRKDWRGYRAAGGVMAVSRRLADALRVRGVRAVVVHPGTGVGPLPVSAAKPDGGLRAIVTAVDLDDPRKDVRFLLRALRAGAVPGLTLTLVGAASDALRAEAAGAGVPTVFTGPVPRDQLGPLTAGHDVFLFASRHDDWGYVLVEALAAGLWVVAPRQSPFDEIVGDCGDLYQPGSVGDLAGRLAGLAAAYSPDHRRKAHARAADLFSRRAFAGQLLTDDRTGGGP